MIRWVKAAALLMMSGITGLAEAATFCVSNTAELQQSLTSAQANGEDDEIRLRQGTYPVPTGGFQHETVEDFDLDISGGWAGLGGSCADNSNATAFDTILDGGGGERVLRIDPGMFNDLGVSVLTLSNGRKSSGAGLLIDPNGGAFRGTLLIERCAFLNNESISFGGSGLTSSEGQTVIVRNSLFAENQGSSSAQFIQLADTTVYFTNNTVVDNVSAGEGAGVDFLFVSQGPRPEIFVANNILWGNSGQDLMSRNGGVLIVRNNTIEDTALNLNNVGSANLSVDPQLEQGPMAYGLAPLSPLRDYGIQPPRFTSIPPPFEDTWSVGEQDFEGRDRVQGAGIDVGAFEASPNLLFTDGFE